MKFGVSQPVPRREDPRLLRGEGRFIDDWTPPGALHAVVLRAPFAHARIGDIAVDEARAAPGVHAVYTGADLAAAAVGGIACVAAPPETPWAGIREGDRFRERHQPVLAADRVRFVGECVAFVVAGTRAQALDASERIEIDYEPLPAVTAVDEAPGGPPVWDDVSDNVSFRWEIGDAPATGSAFAAAHRVVRRRVVNNRVQLCPLEARGVVAEYGEERWTLHVPTQMPHGVKRQLAAVLGVEEGRIRVLVRDVGGGFGGKNSIYPEHVLAAIAARDLGRPVKWVADRSEAFLGDAHGRDLVSHAELALDARHRILGLRMRNFANLGAYTASRGAIPPTLAPLMATNTYRIPAAHADVAACFTHTVPTDPYRGAGRPEGLYVVERLMDAAAREVGLDPVEFRRRNLVPPDAFPYRTPTGLLYDPCEFDAVLGSALERSGAADFPARRRESEARGRLRGLGIACYVERCGGGAGLSERANLLVDADGTVTLLIGSMSNGQGHETAYSQILAERLGLPFEKIRVVQGDTDRVASGTGTGGSWSLPMGGAAVFHAVDRLVETAKPIAADALEAAAEDVEFRDGAFRVAGTDLALSFEDTAARAAADGRPRSDGAPGLEALAVYEPENNTYPYGTHLCEIEVDPETGAVRIVAYTAVHDFGQVLNPLLLAGQVHGGLAQGLGQALLEHTVHDGEGQLLSASFMDYGIPPGGRPPRLRVRAVDHPVTGEPPRHQGLRGSGGGGLAAGRDQRGPRRARVGRRHRLRHARHPGAGLARDPRRILVVCRGKRAATDRAHRLRPSAVQAASASAAAAGAAGRTSPRWPRRIASIRRRGSAAPHRSWSPTENAARYSPPIRSLRTRPTAMSRRPLTAAGVSSARVASGVFSTSRTHSWAPPRSASISSRGRSSRSLTVTACAWQRIEPTRTHRPSMGIGSPFPGATVPRILLPSSNPLPSSRLCPSPIGRSIQGSRLAASGAPNRLVGKPSSPRTARTPRSSARAFEAGSARGPRTASPMAAICAASSRMWAAPAPEAAW